MAPAVLLMGAAPWVRWRGAAWADISTRLRWSGCASLAISAAWLAVLRAPSALTGLGLLLACWSVASALASLADRLRHQRGRRLAALRQLPSSYVGMLLAHTGVGVFIAGVTLVSSQESLRELPMKGGDSTELAGYAFRFDGVRPLAGPNYEALAATVTVSRNGSPVTTLAPQRRIYRSQQMPTTEAAIDVGWTRDLYVALGEAIDGQRWAMRIHVKPFVDWIWIGCLIMAAGGLLAASDRRYRVRQRAAVSEVGGPQALPAAGEGTA
jgi:cytochrome c-type biogenesis protein CcmF